MVLSLRVLIFPSTPLRFASGAPAARRFAPTSCLAQNVAAFSLTFPFHYAAADDLELDFAGAFENRQHPRVAPEALHVELHRVTIAAVNLHRLARHPLRHLGREYLGEARLVIASFAA